MKKLVIKGGAVVGSIFSFRSPIATLTLFEGQLELNLHMVIKLNFKFEDIISVVPYRLFLSSKKGIRINHKRNDYRSYVVFYSKDISENKIAEINQILNLSK